MLNSIGDSDIDRFRFNSKNVLSKRRKSLVRPTRQTTWNLPAATETGEKCAESRHHSAL